MKGGSKMEYVYRVLDLLKANPVAAVALGVAIAAVLLHKHPVVFLVLAVLGVVVYLVFSLASVGTKQKRELINRSTNPQLLVPGELPLVLIDKDLRFP
jgi:hypothetical protein